MFAAKNELLTRPSGSYQISRSLRFRQGSSNNAYLSRTPASAGSQTKWTMSFWVKRGSLSSSQIFVSAGTSGVFYLQFQANDTLRVRGSTVDINTTAVFRDPSAWYSVVIVWDSANATPANRLIIYVNGVSQALTTVVGVALNETSEWNSTSAHNIGRYSFNGTLYFDGYLTEFNFVNNAALLATDFGAFDTNGVWQPARYTGSYGTNGFYLPFNNLNSTSQNLLTYSEQFDNAAWQTPASLVAATITPNSTTAPNGTVTADTVNYSGTTTHPCYQQIGISLANGATITTSMYVKASSGASFLLQCVLLSPTVQDNYAVITFTGGVATSTPYAANLTTTVVDVGNGWYRVTATATNQTGVTATVCRISIGQNNLSGVSSIYVWGAQMNYGSAYPPYIATVATAQTTATTNLGADYQIAGGGWNNWLSTNISTSSGTTYDSMIDSPTNYADGGNGRGNYCTWNPVYKNATVATTDGNLSANSGASAAAHRIIFGTQGFTTPSYFEITTSGGSTTMVSLVGAGQATTGTADGVFVGSFSKSFGLGYATNAASWYLTGATNANGAATNLVDGTWGFAVDPANGKAWVRNTSGSWIGGGDPAAGTLPTFTWTSDGLPWFPVMSFYNIATTFVGILNAGQRSYAFTAPSGFSALNTQNLPTPTIAAGNKYFDASLYQADGVNSKTIVNSGGFQPDFVWIKDRATAGNDHTLWDSVRGNGVRLYSNSTAVEAGMGQLTSLNSNGFTVGYGSGQVNYLTDSYVGWQWKGGNGTSNIAVNAYGSTPSIASIVSANTSAGFSVVTYTGNGTTTASVGHGLGATPSMILIKRRDTTAQDWGVYHTSGGLKLLQINTTSAWWGSGANYWYSLPSSSVFYPDNSALTDHYQNVLNATYVAYCFAPIAGYSAFGSWQNNNSNDNTFVYLGFRPRLILLKNYDNIEQWYIFDSARQTYNIPPNATSWLNPNQTGAEGASFATTATIDLLSNGFKIRTTNPASGEVSFGTRYYIYAAFAENPFKYARAR